MSLNILNKMRFLNVFKRRIYLDYAAATPVAKEVWRAMRPFFFNEFGNPSAIHIDGTTAREAIESARKAISKVLHVRHDNVIFTGSGTESNNLAIYGLLRRIVKKGVSLNEIEIISTKIEHPSILKVLGDLLDRGCRVSFVKTDEYGCIDKGHFESLLSEKTRLVTFAYANSEIGVVQDVKRITRSVRKFNQEYDTDIKIHLDASQAPLWLSCEMDMLGVDLMTLDGGKCYGPKGVGVLAYQHGVELEGVLLGGDQEHGLRAGTENTALIVGCAEAVVRAQGEWKSRSEATASLRDFMSALLLSEIEGSVLNGSTDHRIANNVNISILGIDSEFAVITLDAKGISVSTRSACSGAGGDGSNVVRSMTGDEDRAQSTIRFSLGIETQKKDLIKVVSLLKAHVIKMRKSKRNLQAA